MTGERCVAAVFRKGGKVDIGELQAGQRTWVPEKLWSRSAWKPFLGV